MKTIIQAYVQKDDCIEVDSILLLVCEHEITLNAAVILPMKIGAAFKDWYMKTTEGKDYVDDNGVNWGDALEIPDGFLAKHGIEGLYPLVSGNGAKKIERIEFDGFIVVNHDEPLFDLGEADDELDGKEVKPKFYECGICGHYHPAEWNGDCREDSNRFTATDLEEKHGKADEGWEEVPMPK
jgi:hypothetical protein